jgi:hypothetical protein
MGGIGRKLLDKVSEAFDIFRDCGGHFGVEHLAKKQLMLIPAEAFMDESRKGFPGYVL